MDYSSERITDRRAIARIKMEAQVAADAIKGELCNYIRETADPCTIADIKELATTHPGVYKYIRRLESINNNIYCTTCDRIKHVTGFNEHDSGVDHSYNDALFEQQCANMRRKIDTLAATIKEQHDTYVANKRAIEEYFKGILNELHECKKTIDGPQKSGQGTQDTPTADIDQFVPLQKVPLVAPRPQKMHVRAQSTTPSRPQSRQQSPLTANMFQGVQRVPAQLRPPHPLAQSMQQDDSNEAPELNLLCQNGRSGTLDDIFKPLMQFDDDGMF
jgi:hypothetical protein